MLSFGCCWSPRGFGHHDHVDEELSFDELHEDYLEAVDGAADEVDKEAALGESAGDGADAKFSEKWMAN